MNLRQITATVFAAIMIGVAFWATMGPPPKEEHISMIGMHRLAP
jgi:hypothetical protein